MSVPNEPGQTEERPFHCVTRDPNIAEFELHTPRGWRFRKWGAVSTKKGPTLMGLHQNRHQNLGVAVSPPAPRAAESAPG